MRGKARDAKFGRSNEPSSNAASQKNWPGPSGCAATRLALKREQTLATTDVWGYPWQAIHATISALENRCAGYLTFEHRAAPPRLPGCHASGQLAAARRTALRGAVAARAAGCLRTGSRGRRAASGTGEGQRACCGTCRQRRGRPRATPYRSAQARHRKQGQRACGRTDQRSAGPA